MTDGLCTACCEPVSDVGCDCPPIEGVVAVGVDDSEVQGVAVVAFDGPDSMSVLTYLKYSLSPGKSRMTYPQHRDGKFSQGGRSAIETPAGNRPNPNGHQKGGVVRYFWISHNGKL